jgi:hypothetical protein
MCARVRITFLLSVRIARVARNLPIWLLARLKEYRGMVIYYLQFFQYVNPLDGGLIRGY